MAVVNITVTNDADFYRTFQYVMASNNAPIDITGSSLEMMFRRDAADATVYLRLGTDTGEIAIIDPVNGMFTVRITQAVLEQLALGTYDQSNIMTRGIDKIRIWSGTLTNNAGPTR